MKTCVFCRIVEGTIPCFRVYEDSRYLGFLDISPLNPGNVLLIPKTHYRWVYDVPSFGAYFEAAKKIAMAIQEALKASSINFLTVGEEVPHAHIRIIPRYTDDGGVLKLINIKTIPNTEMKKIAESIAKKLG